MLKKMPNGSNEAGMLLISIMVGFLFIFEGIQKKAELYFIHVFWELLQGSRTDRAMLLRPLFLFINGSGVFSIDQYLLLKPESWKS
jgi:uncharacterized membrane protein YphA (DoxX/SURF4 family)